MHGPFRAGPRARHRLGAVASLVLAIAVGLVTFAPAASAHHPEIDASVACGTGGEGYVVDFESVSWQTSGGNGGGGANPHIDISYRLRTAGGEPSAWTTLPWQPTYRYTAEDDYRFGDTFPLGEPAGGDEIQVRATAAASWGNGTAGGQTTSTSWLPFPTGCQPPGSPQVGSSVACTGGDGVVTVTLANTAPDGAASVTFEVTDPRTATVTTRELGPGQSDVVVLTGLPDGPLTVPVTADSIHHDQTVTVACDRPGTPSVGTQLACTGGDGVVTVTLANTGGDLPVTFVVTDPRTSSTTTRVLAPGQSDSVVLTGFPDGPVTIPVTADDVAYDQTVTVACDRPGTPSVATQLACTGGDGVVTVTLANTGGDLPVTFVVTDPRTSATTTRVLAPGQSDSVVLSGFPDGPVTIPVTADDTSVDQSVTVTCDVPGTPQVSAGAACTSGDGDITVTLANVGGTEPIRFVVTDPRDGSSTARDVAVGTSATVILRGFADGPVTIGVLADGAALDQTLTVDCDVPGVPDVDATPACVDFDGNVVVALANVGGTEPIDFVVTDPRDGATTARTVAVGASATVTLAGLPDGTYTVGITADGAVLDRVVTVDCDRPGVPAVYQDVECAELGGRVVVTLANTSPAGEAEPITFEVTDPRDPTIVTALTLAAGEHGSVVVEDLPDGEWTIPVSADAVALDPVVVTVDCRQPVVDAVTMTCSVVGQTVTIANTGGTDATVSVRKDDELVEEVVVPADDSVDVLVPMDEDETATITVVDGETELVRRTVTQDCEDEVTSTTTSTTAPSSTSTTPPPGDPSPTTVPAAQVLGETLTRDVVAASGTLPVTGTNPLGLVAFGAALAAFGTFVVLSVRRPG